MTMVAFLQAANSSNLPSSWRHPESKLDFLKPEYFQRIARTLEDGKFHLAFFDDRLAMPEYGDSHEEAVRSGIRVVRLDVGTVLMTMAGVTSRLGLGATFSTTYHDPYHVARLFATIDLMTNGRAAWNIVTSVNDSEAANFGRDEHMEHTLRYDRADEFLEVVLGHWNTWAEDAMILDKKKPYFADPAKVRRLSHSGEFFKSRGPFTVPRSVQGHPLLMQAGQSGRGSAFAARWAELQFVTNHDIVKGKAQYAAFKTDVKAAGRDPDQVLVAQACYVIVGETPDVAQQKRALIESLATPMDTLIMLGDRVNIDFSNVDIDAPLKDDELAKLSHWHKLTGRVAAEEGRPNPSLRDLLNLSGRGTIREFPVFCGTPLQVADEMERWFVERACDGFVLAATHTPGTYEDFVRLVVPELQRRGLFHEDYEGNTLRENVGLAHPQRRA
jgi:FMN-dependent oxidoreductase (nitrilotriacetate monooxygenase family)